MAYTCTRRGLHHQVVYTSFDVKLQMYIRDGPAGSVRSARAASLSGAGRRF